MADNINDLFKQIYGDQISTLFEQTSIFQFIERFLESELCKELKLAGYTFTQPPDSYVLIITNKLGESIKISGLFMSNETIKKAVGDLSPLGKELNGYSSSAD